MERGNAGDFIEAQKEGYRGLKAELMVRIAGDVTCLNRAREWRGVDEGVGADMWTPHVSDKKKHGRARTGLCWLG